MRFKLGNIEVEAVTETRMEVINNKDNDIEGYVDAHGIEYLVSPDEMEMLYRNLYGAIGAKCIHEYEDGDTSFAESGEVQNCINEREEALVNLIHTLRDLSKDNNLIFKALYAKR